MKTLYVMDPFEISSLEGDSTYMMMLEANRRGWETFWCEPTDLFAEGGVAYARMRKVVVSDHFPHFFKKILQQMCRWLIWMWSGCVKIRRSIWIIFFARTCWIWFQQPHWY